MNTHSGLTGVSGEDQHFIAPWGSLLARHTAPQTKVYIALEKPVDGFTQMPPQRNHYPPCRTQMKVRHTFWVPAATG
jgi:hypothetical protein